MCSRGLGFDFGMVLQTYCVLNFKIEPHWIEMSK